MDWLYGLVPILGIVVALRNWCGPDTFRFRIKWDRTSNLFAVGLALFGLSTLLWNDEMSNINLACLLAALLCIVLQLVPQTVGAEVVRISLGIALILVILVASFAWIYEECGLVDVDGELVTDWKTALYFSSITFSTIGYGDIRPIGASRLLASIEGIMQFFLLGPFVTIFVRGLQRARSALPEDAVVE